jgi:hypothetical protein
MADVEGGSKLEAYLEELAKKARPVTLKVVFLEGEQASKAAMNEFGTAHAPPRPFFRHAIQTHEGEWPALASALLLAAEYDTEHVANQMGALIAGQITESIIEYDLGPPLAPSTIAKKGHATPLIDTGAMSKSVSWEVE